MELTRSGWHRDAFGPCGFGRGALLCRRRDRRIRRSSVLRRCGYYGAGSAHRSSSLWSLAVRSSRCVTGCARIRLIGESARTCSARRSARSCVSSSGKQGAAPGARDLEARRGFLRQGDRQAVTCFGFVEAERAQFPVSLLCRVVGVTRQGYYAWKRRGPSDRELADIDLAVRIRRVHEQPEGIYGAPRIQAELRLAHGVRVGKKRVARLMRQLGLKGADGRGGGPRTTIREAGRSSAPDLVDRDFTRAEPNRLWVCDIKYVQTGQGFLFLACVQDVYSRRIIGRSMRDDLKTELVPGALGMAAHTRETAGIIAHSDHGSQYTSLAYGSHAKESGIDLSMGSVGNPGTTRSPRHSSPASRKNSSNANASPHASTHACASSGTSNASTTPPTPLQPRHAQPHQLRTTTPNKGHRGLDPRCQPKRVNSKGQG